MFKTLHHMIRDISSYFGHRTGMKKKYRMNIRSFEPFFACNIFFRFEPFFKNFSFLFSIPPLNLLKLFRQMKRIEINFIYIFTVFRIIMSFPKNKIIFVQNQQIPECICVHHYHRIVSGRWFVMVSFLGGNANDRWWNHSTILKCFPRVFSHGIPNDNRRKKRNIFIGKWIKMELLLTQFIWTFMDQKSISFLSFFFSFSLFLSFGCFFFGTPFIRNFEKKTNNNFGAKKKTTNRNVNSISRSVFIQLSIEYIVCQLESILYELYTVGRQSISRNNFIW